MGAEAGRSPAREAPHARPGGCGGRGGDGPQTARVARARRSVMDRADMRRALVDLRVAVDDADSVTEDMLRAPRRRELGPVLHRRNYSEARGKITSAIAYLFRAVDETPDGGVP